MNETNEINREEGTLMNLEEKPVNENELRIIIQKQLNPPFPREFSIIYTSFFKQIENLEDKSYVLRIFAEETLKFINGEVDKYKTEKIKENKEKGIEDEEIKISDDFSEIKSLKRIGITKLIYDYLSGLTRPEIIFEKPNNGSSSVKQVLVQKKANDGSVL